MRVLHVTESHEAVAGGVTTVVQGLAKWLVTNGGDAAVFSVGKNPVPPPPGAMSWNCSPTRHAARWGWSPLLADSLAKAIAEFRPTVIHLHGAWLAPQLIAGRIARRRGIPFVASFHGMLEPYHWSDRGPVQTARKRLYWSAFASPLFMRANAIHAITPLEAEHLAGWLPGKRPTVIPNAVDLSTLSARSQTAPNPTIERRVGFLGRLHPKKGIDLLIRAFDEASLGEEWQLSVAGPDWEKNYTSQLQSLAEKSRAKSRIHFLGPVLGDDRLDYLRRSWVVAVPSLSEVVAMVNLEAAACATPTITSYETGLVDWEEGGGRLAHPGVTAIAGLLREFASLSLADRMQKGAASLALVRKRYSWDVVGPKWQRFYEHISSAT